MLLCQEFILEDWNWHVKVFYVVDLIPIDYIVKQLEKMGCDKKDVDSAIEVLGSDSYNRGITFSNNQTRESVIVIGETSCPAQFSHSYDHEKLHLAMHISKTDGIDPYSEELAYLIGDIGFQTFPMAKWFLCEHCREKLN